MNTDLSVLRVIMTTARIELGLAINPIEGLAPFDTSQHPAYTFEEPNSLTVEELRAFLRQMRERFPEHYAMTLLGFSIGKWPSPEEQRQGLSNVLRLIHPQQPRPSGGREGILFCTDSQRPDFQLFSVDAAGLEPATSTV